MVVEKFRLPFFDRNGELARLKAAFADAGSALVVIYGRRRCGKSRLLLESLDPSRDVYFQADLRDAAVQRQALAREIARRIPRFDSVLYPEWSAILEAWRERAPAGAILAIDELPYLVQIAPELPSVFQRLVETRSTGPLRIVLCGSSQRMMYGLALDAAAPLYGRAREVLKVEPLAAKWIRNALHLDDRQAVEAYSVWGGLPRNWELAAAHKGTGAAMKALILDKAGILHGEPPRLLLDDLRSAVQAGSILSLVGAGAHRIGEIAARLGRPVTALTRPLALLVDLGYIRREVPFGESPLSSRRSLYRIADPFVEFWYRFVQPAGSLLEMDLVDEVHSRIRAELPSHVAEVWEHLARRSVPRLPIDGVTWGPASRWWGNDLAGRSVEVDVAAESLDGHHVLVGEAKWSARRQTAGVIARLRELSPKLPFVRGHTVHLAAWVRDEERESFEEVSLIGPCATLDAS